MTQATLDRVAVDSGMDRHQMDRRQWLAIACVQGVMVLVVLDGAIANVALPVIAPSLHVSAAQSVWVVMAYQLAVVMALLPSAALGESLGFRRVFTGGIALFTLSSLLCALAPTLPLLTMARLLQGLGGAAVMALGVAVIRQVVPPQMLGAVIGWNALTVALTSAAGPCVGALILSVARWPWLFAVNVPLGLAIVLARGVLPVGKGTGRALDPTGVGLNAAGFALVVLGAQRLVERPAIAVPCVALGIALLLVLARRERAKEAPLIPVDLLGLGSFRMSVIASICCFAGQGAGMIALPFHVHHALGQSTLVTGLVITPWPLTVALAAPVAGRLAERVPTGWLCAAGGAVLAMGLLTIALLPVHGSALWLIPPVMVCGLGFGLFQVPNNRNMFLSAPKARSGAAGGMQGTARLLGQTTGSVLMTLLFTAVTMDLAPRLGMAIGAGLALVAGVVSLMRARDGAA